MDACRRQRLSTSLPSRGRGSKHLTRPGASDQVVAPFTGARIETPRSQRSAANPVAPFTGARIETRHAASTPRPAVAPFTGARIETSWRQPLERAHVAPFTGARIETSQCHVCAIASIASLPSRGRGSKLSYVLILADDCASLPSRGRGSKHQRTSNPIQRPASLPSRGRGSKTMPWTGLMASQSRSRAIALGVQRCGDRRIEDFIK